MKRVLLNACYLGSADTPLTKQEKSIIVSIKVVCQHLGKARDNGQRGLEFLRGPTELPHSGGIPVGHQRYEQEHPQQNRHRARNRQVRPLPFGLQTQMTTKNPRNTKTCCFL